MSLGLCSHIFLCKYGDLGFLLTDCDFPSVRCGGAGTSAAVITALPCAVAPGPIFTTFREAVCKRAPGISLLQTWLGVDKRLEFVYRQTRCKVVLPCWHVLFEMQIQWAHCAVYPLIACLFGLGANVSLTREKSVFYKGQGNFCSRTGSVRQHPADVPDKTVLPWTLRCSHLLLWLETRHCCFSLCNVLWEKIIICSGRRSHSLHLRACDTTSESSSNFKSLTNMFCLYLIIDVQSAALILQTVISLWRKQAQIPYILHAVVAAFSFA